MPFPACNKKFLPKFNTIPKNSLCYVRMDVTPTSDSAF